MAGLDYDVAVIGSGFGGSVAALRLTEKGYRVRDRRLPDSGVIDPYHRVYGHPGLHIVDGSAVSANLGVNPSLTITARPSGPWRPGRTVASRTRARRSGHPTSGSRPFPAHPAVPAGAPTALRVPQ